MPPNGQKAPSAIRCIKTAVIDTLIADRAFRQKAPSAIRCIKTRPRRPPEMAPLRQKAPSAIRCIKTADELAG